MVFKKVAPVTPRQQQQGTRAASGGGGAFLTFGLKPLILKMIHGIRLRGYDITLLYCS